MSERELRAAIQQACEELELDARARAQRAGRKLVYPLMVGAGLFATNCEPKDDLQPIYSATMTGTGGYTVYGAPAGAPTGTGTGTAVGGGGSGGEGATGSGVGGAVGGAGTGGNAGGEAGVGGAGGGVGGA